MGPGEWRWRRRTGKQGSGLTDGLTCCPGRALPLHMLWFSVSWAHQEWEAS